MTYARERGFIPKADRAILEAFSASEIKLYKHATKYKWTVDELVDTIKLIKSADFKVNDINVDLHKRVAAAVAQGHYIYILVVCQVNSCHKSTIFLSYVK